MKLQAFFVIQALLCVRAQNDRVTIDYDYEHDSRFSGTGTMGGPGPTVTPNAAATFTTMSTTATPITVSTPTTPQTVATTPTTPPTPYTPATTPSTQRTPTTPFTSAPNPTTSSTPTTTPATPTTPSTPPTTPTTPTSLSTSSTTHITSTITIIPPTTPSTTPSTPPTTLSTPSTSTTPSTTHTSRITSSTEPTTLSTPSTQKPLTTQEYIVESAAIVAAVKVQFENKINVDIDYINKFSDSLNDVRGELYGALDDQVYRQETTRRDALRNALKNNPDVDCIRGHEDTVNMAKRLGRVEFEFCEAIVKSEVLQQKEQLNIGRKRIQDEVRKAELHLEDCRRVYLARYDLAVYSSCSQSAKSNLIFSLSSYNISIRGQDTQNRIIKLAECADRSLSRIETILNENYKTITNCLELSGNPMSAYIKSTYLDKYKVDLSSFKLKEQIETAIKNLKTNAEKTSQAAVTLKAILQETKTIRDRGQAEIRDELELLKEVNAYKVAYLKAAIDLASFSKAKDCINQGNDRIRDNLNKRANEVRDCSRKLNLVPSEGNVNDLQNNLRNRDKYEGLVAIANCFADKRTILRGNITLACSTAADASFSFYVAGVDRHLESYFQQLNQLKIQFATCQASVLPWIINQLDQDRLTFENCIQSRVNVNYKLNI